MAAKVYRDNPEWADVTPVPQDDGPAPAAPIAYSPEYVEAFDYFRAVLRSQEKSERVLRLLNHLLQLNPSHYTVWQFRRQVLEALGSDLRKELAFVTGMAQENPKNYQLWYHRQVMVEKLNDPTGEVEFLAEVFEEDAKNYHAWSYRQWLLQAFPALWQQEKAYIEKLIEEDVRNNSAWNQRFFYLTKNPTNAVTKTTNDAALRDELKYVYAQIQRAPSNESAWNYLRGLVDLRSFEALPEVAEYCTSLRGRGVLSPFLLAMQAEICLSRFDKAAADELFALLEEKVDTIRRKYWAFRRQQARAQ